jgi:cephalosporin-C deacetylase-like acetyl esterase
MGQFVRHEIEFAGGDGTPLAGTLTIPSGTPDFPAVVAVHAASGGIRDAPLHRHLASFLPSLGVATFIYDRRGEGASGGRPSNKPVARARQSPPSRTSRSSRLVAGP